MRKFWESIYCPNYISGYNPFILKNMNKAIERLALAINNRQKIVVYGTYNVDGICAVSSLILVLKYLNADVEYLIYDRQESDAVINSVDIKNNVDFLGAELLITLGIGLKSKEEVDLCKDLGIDLIVLENEESDLVNDYIYINPSQKGCQYRYKNLSISGLAFKLMQAIAIYYNMKSINKYLDLILIGIQWAKVSAKGENGVLIKEGNKFLINTNNNGLRSIIEFNNIKEFNDDGINKIIELLIPPIGAVGIMDNARIVLELLTTNDKDRADQIVKYLSTLKKTTSLKCISN
ncbi:MULTISPECIES: DHH family phosphoesterase [Clostridium]|jgi:single-stranded DNA-specific DHH superfamily exonuclease|uniref:Single-stranded-DNA-specific exonuclease RecJ n=1 Tax=Clostridium saccharoperbutylacetonicum N1-4(HMT) TaxID=931276 RepID=M1MEI7_9CLOT|nr:MULTISPECIES: DHH family phosphoesterase [Clostridium]AGF56329.1 single-stranded-DNA-specific exonuclease RecJ [Clostridium saccharoperbutylacetonicum N1-4(HMT)]AQR95069.1 single-stranded-DNA-specific exonuclease RecJ [Clostridium saccharoperbutylacetonicum]NRT62927.1 single-stranded DNA-specific DHH superfamily exonuclease [Clostridium saccharoperbutylacetonicum]NSB26284.1 single-stranded DNA-specific DHH superfamily exonuclease [Clostridium saccharoperbutylacetonicum]NSB30916.1 single-str